jgi:serine/threonine protein kinase
MPNTLGKYQLGKTLGRGVSCKVKRARNAANGNRYAIKILNEGKAYKELMKDEIDVLKKLHHDHIVNLIEVGNDVIQKQDRSKLDR